MQITLPEAAILVTATGVLVATLTFLGVRGRTQRADAKQEGLDKAALNGVVRDVARLVEVEMPRLQRIEILTRENALQIKGLAELESKRSTSVERMLNGVQTIVDHLEKKGT